MTGKMQYEIRAGHDRIRGLKVSGCAVHTARQTARAGRSDNSRWRHLDGHPRIRHPLYQADESPPLLASVGLGLQFSLIASATLLVTPVIVAQSSGRGDSYLDWMVFASLCVVD